jgi:hypothetical protein
MTNHGIQWRKSSYSGTGGGTNDCVEVAGTLGELRDSKNLNGPVLRGNLAQLVQAIKADQLG